MTVSQQLIGTVESIVEVWQPGTFTDDDTTTSPGRFATLNFGRPDDDQRLVVDVTYLGGDVQVGSTARVTVEWGESRFDLITRSQP